jgi:hypothetical protein
MPPDLWTALEKGIHYYKRDATKNKGCASQFPGTFNTPRNLLKQAFIEKDEIGWSYLIKGRFATQWKVYMEQQLQTNCSKSRIQEWAPKLINAMWYYMTRMWYYHNDPVYKPIKQVYQCNA